MQEVPPYQHIYRRGSLHWKVHHGNRKALTLWLANGGDVNLPNENGHTLLHAAVHGRHNHLVQCLLEHGADPNVMSNDGHHAHTPLFQAIISNQTDLFFLLVEHSADTLQKMGSYTYLHFAVEYDTRMVEYLLAHGAVVDAGAWDGVTPLMLATMHDRYDAAVMLFDAGANPNAENAYGSTPFHYVRDARIILALIDHGGDVHRRCANGQTPIFQVSSPEAVDVLIAHGAELDIVDQQGNTPLMVSLAECDIDIERGKTVYLAQDFTMHLARLMIARGMDLNTRNAEGKTALAIAEEEGFTGFPDFLQAHGAKK